MKKIFLLLVIFSGYVGKSQNPPAPVNCNVQSNPPDSFPIPDMYVEKTKGLGRNAEFAYKHRAIKLQKHIDIYDQIFFPVNPFVKMISHFCNDLHFDSLNIWFAEYPNIPDSFTPPGWQSKLTVLFNPMKGGVDLGYFTIQDHGSNFHKLPTSPINVGQNWINNYDTDILPILSSTISNDRDNEYPKGSRKYSDTRFIGYCGEDWIQLLTEINYQNNVVYNDPSYVTGIEVLFSAYDQNGDDEKMPRYRYRMIAQFDFTTNKNGQDGLFFIDDQIDFLKIRKSKKFICGQQFQSNYKDNKGFGIDNGQLCPTVCN